MSDLLSQTAWRRWTVASLLSRLPISMGLLAFVLAGQQSLHSAAQGSVLAGLLGFVAGLLGPWAGRRLDRAEVRRALQRRLLGAGSMMCAFATLVHFRAGFAVLAVTVVVMGAFLAGMMAGFRSLLLVVVESATRRHSHFVESMMVEFGYAIGPLIVSGLYLVTNLETVLYVMAGVFVLSAYLMRRIPEMFVEQVVKPERGSGVTRSTLRIAALGFAVSLAFSLTEGSVSLRMPSIGLETSASGPFLLLLGLSSCIGGLYVSLRPITVGPKRLTAGVLLLAFALTLQPLAWASSPLWLGASLLIASLPLVPLTGLLSSLIEVHAGPNNRGSLFAVLVTASMVGAGTGVSLAGFISTTLSPNAPAMVSSAAFAMLGSAVLTQVAWRSFVHRRDRSVGKR
jgi:hypothetical protein